jgi:DNA-binding XRE family transcriptional regulator
MASTKGNQKIAAKRGEEWRKKLVAGKMEARLYPSNLMVARAKRNLTQTSIAQRIGVSLATYGAIERGHRGVRPETAEVIAATIQAPLKSLFRKSSVGKMLAIQANIA